MKQMQSREDLPLAPTNLAEEVFASVSPQTAKSKSGFPIFSISTSAPPITLEDVKKLEHE